MTSLSDRYGPEAQLQCVCQGWYGPTAASHQAHKAVYGHWPHQPRQAGGETRERTDPDQGEGSDPQA